MKNIKDIYAALTAIEEPKTSTAKIILKTALITTAVLAVVPTVFKISKDKNTVEGYGILSSFKYEKKTNEEGKTQRDWSYTLIDLSRYGLDTLNIGAEPDAGVEIEVLDEMAELDAFEEVESTDEEEA